MFCKPFSGCCPHIRDVIKNLENGFVRKPSLSNVNLEVTIFKEMQIKYQGKSYDDIHTIPGHRGANTDC